LIAERTEEPVRKLVQHRPSLVIALLMRARTDAEGTPRRDRRALRIFASATAEHRGGMHRTADDGGV
jgi:hypothetical protein